MKLISCLSILLIASKLSFAQNTDSLHLSAAKSGTTKDTIGVFNRVEVEASYPGGGDSWKAFLYDNLRADAPFKDLPKKVKYFEQTAIVQFIVCTDGSVCDVKVVNEVLPSIKKEAERVIKKSGTWIPAQQNGRQVKAYRKQPITFVVTGD